MSTERDLLRRAYEDELKEFAREAWMAGIGSELHFEDWWAERQHDLEGPRSMSVNLKWETEEVTDTVIDAVCSDPALAAMADGPAKDFILKLIPVHYGEKVSAVITKSWPV